MMVRGVGWKWRKEGGGDQGGTAAPLLRDKWRQLQVRLRAGDLVVTALVLAECRRTCDVQCLDSAPVDQLSG